MDTTSLQPASAANRARLNGLSSELDGLSAILSSGVRQRREKDDARVSEMKERITQVEKSVVLETERRLELAVSLREHVSTQVAALRTRIESLISASQTELQRRIDEVHARITSLEERFASDRERVLADLATRHADLLARVSEFMKVVDEERRARLERERAIIDRIGKEEVASLSRYDMERTQREQVYMATRARLEEELESQSKAQEAFHAATGLEIASLKNALASEESARLAEDDEIAATITRYSSKLQSTLAVLVSMDTAF